MVEKTVRLTEDEIDLLSMLLDGHRIVVSDGRWVLANADKTDRLAQVNTIAAKLGDAW